MPHTQTILSFLMFFDNEFAPWFQCTLQCTKHPDDVIPELVNGDEVQMHMQILLKSSQQDSVRISSFHPQAVQLRMQDVT